MDTKNISESTTIIISENEPENIIIFDKSNDISKPITIITSDNEKENLISDKKNIINRKQVRSNYKIFTTVNMLILLYIAIFIIVPIFQLIYAYDFNSPIICNVRFTNGTLIQFGNTKDNIGEFDAIDFVIIDGICELVFQPLIILIHIVILKYKSLQTKKTIWLISLLLIANTIRYFSFEIMFVNYLIDLWNNCSDDYLAFLNIQYIMNVNEFEDIIILRVTTGLLNFSAQCATALYYGNIMLKKVF